MTQHNIQNKNNHNPYLFNKSICQSATNPWRILQNKHLCDSMCGIQLSNHSSIWMMIQCSFAPSFSHIIIFGLHCSSSIIKPTNRSCPGPCHLHFMTK